MNPLMNPVNHISPNQLTKFYMMRTLVVYVLVVFNKKSSHQKHVQTQQRHSS